MVIHKRMQRITFQESTTSPRFVLVTQARESAPCRDFVRAAFLLAVLSHTALGDRDGTASITSRANTAGHAHGAPPQVDFTQFSKMLAGMLVLREGGLPEATQAIPHLAATTHHYLNTQVQHPPSITDATPLGGKGAQVCTSTWSVKLKNTQSGFDNIDHPGQATGYVIAATAALSWSGVRPSSTRSLSQLLL